VVRAILKAVSYKLELQGLQVYIQSMFVFVLAIFMYMFSLFFWVIGIAMSFVLSSIFVCLYYIFKIDRLQG